MGVVRNGFLEEMEPGKRLEGQVEGGIHSSLGSTGSGKERSFQQGGHLSCIPKGK